MVEDLNVQELFVRMGQGEIKNSAYIAVRIPPELHKYLVDFAAERQGSVGSAARYLLLMGVKEQQFQKRRQSEKGD